MDKLDEIKNYFKNKKINYIDIPEESIYKINKDIIKKSFIL
jgi:hypothetical protein